MVEEDSHHRVEEEVVEDFHDRAVAAVVEEDGRDFRRWHSQGYKEPIRGEE